MLPEMLDHIIQTFFPQIWKAPSGSLREVRPRIAHGIVPTNSHRELSSFQSS